MVEDEEGNMKNANDMVYVGMIFESEDDAYEKYNEFARKVGFGIWKGNSYKRPDGTVRSRVFVCFKEGFRRNDHRAKNVREHKETITGCKARMMIKQNEDEWVASSITFEHNHLLLTPRKEHMLRSHRSMKDDSRFHGFESRPPTGFKVCSTNDGDTASMQPSVLNNRKSEVLIYAPSTPLAMHKPLSLLASTLVSSANYNAISSWSAYIIYAVEISIVKLAMTETSNYAATGGQVRCAVFKLGTTACILDNTSGTRFLKVGLAA
ncbi:hypothetical protein IFM89_032885 [Coptis chinensis]|uniref:FAR1 domain-containing protein n=1 Tax=Coptis chinensis TaxID=261450 RepID=A0A835M812_9MAGN|nr:hypothetical protein IFM89_032885 [Coptis chinensis]